jgi:hypothetical protein
MMSGTNVTQLRQRLQDLEMKLQRFDVELADDFRALDVAWSELDSVWDGVAYQEFQGSWNDVRAMILQYVSLSNKYEQFLRERVAWLRRFESGRL